MMELSFEIPLPHLKEYLSVSCFPFGLAHLMLDQSYKHAGTYHTIMQGCLLDNSMYELQDVPLTNAELLEAAKVCRPCSVVAPDWMDQATKTLDATEDLRTMLLNTGTLRGVKVSGVVQGRDLQERLECFYQLQAWGCRPICFPFRTDRASVIGHLHAQGLFVESGWYHLLGLQHLTELAWRFPGRWSLDTAKPFKGVKLHLGSLRGLGRLDVHKELSERARRIAFRNIAYFRKISIGGVVE